MRSETHARPARSPRRSAGHAGFAWRPTRRCSRRRGCLVLPDLRQAARGRLLHQPSGRVGVGCPDCADERELAGATLSRDEWLGPTRVLGEVLARFGLPTGAQARKPTLTPARRPNAHSWDVLAPEGSRYHLRRFSGWYPDDAVEFHHSLMTEVAATGLPVPHVLRSRDGREIVEANGCAGRSIRAGGARHGGERVAVAASQGGGTARPTPCRLEYATPKGAPFALWGA